MKKSFNDLRKGKNTDLFVYKNQPLGHKFGTQKHPNVMHLNVNNNITIATTLMQCVNCSVC